VLRGELLNDVDESAGQGKMDPYVRLISGGQKFETKAATDQGKRPVWNETFLFEDLDEVKVEVLDKDEKKSDSLAAG
jgi:Ca2+-dependent lipid-binding protein